MRRLRSQTHNPDTTAGVGGPGDQIVIDDAVLVIV